MGLSCLGGKMLNLFTSVDQFLKTRQGTIFWTGLTRFTGLNPDNPGNPVQESPPPEAGQKLTRGIESRHETRSAANRAAHLL